MSISPAMATDAAIVLGIASTAMPFARTPEEAAERWLRVLLVNGRAGAALRALGVSEGPLGATGESPGSRETANADGVDQQEAVSLVTTEAARIAGERGARQVTTIDVLMAVMGVYGADFDRVLHAHGTGRDQVIEQLAVDQSS